MYQVKPFQDRDNQTRYRVWHVYDDGRRKWCGPPDGWDSEEAAAEAALHFQLASWTQDSQPPVIGIQIREAFLEP